MEMFSVDKFIRVRNINIFIVLVNIYEMFLTQLLFYFKFPD